MGNRFACMASMVPGDRNGPYCLELRVIRRGHEPAMVPLSSMCLMSELTWACAVGALGPRYGATLEDAPSTTVLEASPLAVFVDRWFAENLSQRGGAHETLRDALLEVRLVCDPTVSLGDLLRSPDAVLHFGPATPEECSTTSKRNAVAAFATLVGAGVYLTGQLAHHMRFPTAARTHIPHVLQVGVLDASFNALHDADCHWVAMDLLDRCERSKEGVAAAGKYAARLADMAIAANVVAQRDGDATRQCTSVNVLDPLPNERMLHAFSNACFGPHVHRLVLQGARLTTLGLSRLLRTVFQTALPCRRQVSPTTSTTSESLVCKSLMCVDLRGPWTDASTTSLRVVDEAMERLCRLDGTLPEVLVATCAAPTDHLGDTVDICEQSQEPMQRQSPLQEVSNTAHPAQHDHLQLAVDASATQGGVAMVKHSVAPSGPPNCRTMDAPMASPTQRTPMREEHSLPDEEGVLSSPLDTHTGQRSPSTEAAYDPVEEMALLAHATQQVLPHCQALCLEVEEAAARAKLLAATWQNGLLRHIDGLMALVASAPNSTPLKSDGIVAEYRSATCQAVTFIDAVAASLHVVARHLVQCVHGAAHTHDGQVHPTARAFAETVGLSISKLQSSDPGMVWAEEFLQALDVSAPHTTTLGRLTASDTTSLLYAATASLRKQRSRERDASTPWAQWRSMWNAVLETSLLASSDNGEVELFTSSSLSDDCNATAQRMVALLVALRDAAWRLSHDCLKWSVSWVERWVALLRRWLVESEIGRRQAVRALHRRNTAARPATPTHAQEVEIDPPKPSMTSKQNGRQTPTRRTSPLNRALSPKAPHLDLYAHVRAKVSTQRVVQPTEKEDVGVAACGASEHVGRGEGDAPAITEGGTAVDAVQSTSNVEVPWVTEDSDGGQRRMVNLASPAPVLSVPARLTNSTALRKIVMLEAKLADLEAQKMVASPLKTHRRRRNSDAATPTAVPQPRQGPPPVKMEWSNHTGTFGAQHAMHLPHTTLHSNGSVGGPTVHHAAPLLLSHAEPLHMVAPHTFEGASRSPPTPNRAAAVEPCLAAAHSTGAGVVTSGIAHVTHAAPVFIKSAESRSTSQEVPHGCHNRATSCTSLGSYFKPTVASVPPEVEVAHRVIFRPLSGNHLVEPNRGKGEGAMAPPETRGVVSQGVLSYILMDGVRRTGVAPPQLPVPATAVATKDGQPAGGFLEYYSSRSTSRAAGDAVVARTDDDEYYCV